MEVVRDLQLIASVAARLTRENKDHAIIPGSFVLVRVHLSAPRWEDSRRSADFPGEAAVRRGWWNDDKRVKYRRVKLADQAGQKAQLVDGLAEGELVAVNVGESISDGDKIQPVQQAARRSGEPFSQLARRSYL